MTHIKRSSSSHVTRQLSQKRRSFARKRMPMRTARSWAHILYYALVIAFFASTLYVLFFSPFLRVTQIAVEGTRAIRTEDVLSTISSLTDGTFGGIVPKNNYLFLTPQRLTRAVEGISKNIATVEITRRFPHAITVTITEHRALLLWCPVQWGEECAIIDENGIAYARVRRDAPEIAHTRLVVVHDEGGVDGENHAPIFDRKDVDALVAMRDYFERGGMISLGEDVTFLSHVSHDVRVTTTEGWEIMFTTQLPLEQTARTLFTFLGRSLAPDERARLAYVDLRFEHAVYYAFKDDGEQKEIQRAEERPAFESSDPTRQSIGG